MMPVDQRRGQRLGARLRESRLSDLAMVASWVRSEAECHFWASVSVAYPIDATTLPDEIAFSEHGSWTAVVEDRPVAFGQLVSKKNGRLHLARLIVAPDLRGGGYGRFLVSTLVDKALARNPPTVSLNVSPDNVTALKLYRSLGFVPTQRPPEETIPDALYMEHRQAKPLACS